MKHDRIGGMPEQLEKEADNLAHEWLISDTMLSLEEYLDKHSSESLKLFMKEISSTREIEAQ